MHVLLVGKYLGRHVRIPSRTPGTSSWKVVYA
jgi:hypothetical protein